MYEAFFGFREKPFSLLPDPGFLFLGQGHSSALATLEYALLNGSALAVVTGDIGCGKTTLVRHLLNDVGEEWTVGLISNTHRSFGDLLQWVLFAFGLDYRAASKPELYEIFVEFLIKEYASGRRTVLIVDEAQNMEPDVLEDLRLLLNINADKDLLLHVFLVGQPELRRKLSAPGLTQFTHRIGVDFHLGALTAEETRSYIRHRLEAAGGDVNLFDEEACTLVRTYTDGVPRLINLLCDSALAYAFGEQTRRIGPDEIRDVVRDKLSTQLSQFHSETSAEVTRLGDAQPRRAKASRKPVVTSGARAAAVPDVLYPHKQDESDDHYLEAVVGIVPADVDLELSEVHDQGTLAGISSGWEAAPSSDTDREMLRELFSSLRPEED